MDECKPLATGLSEYGHSKHDRAASILTLRVSQYIPALGGTGGPGGGGSGGAANASTPAQHLVSTIVIADTPGAEPLAMDPGVLRLREGARQGLTLVHVRAQLEQLQDTFMS